ncbi:diguanylate cyclase [Brevibacillus reuszeri]|uniref:Diguanylate cyclase n=1 Tax=Brevibacillus reuszeri TaxID=54915 RepID=A0A0K9YVM8_9BACL|nr:GGDEF domain-containing protein [Brevibacillus reuszeri]KNB72707.1 diguanylate cyclase [Brevibacillus reuszeri]MED1860590.1 GGDEF domain-containing protein [Brevibacillus reuszeri]GED70259.1 diguanylate cyclase [Brevibacillus reuszeri]
MNISEIMTTSINTITSGKSVSYAAEQMNESNTRWLVVIDHGVVMGVVTSRDVLSAHPNRIVADAMSDHPSCLSADLTVWEAHSYLQEKNRDVALIMNGEQLIGLLTKEAVRMKIAEYVDPLTGLYEAPYIQYIGEQFLKESIPFHLLFIDLNDFGQINKLHGHPFGDDVIRRYSSVLASLASEQGDHLCRYAGDEFVMISTAEEEQIQRGISLLTQPTHIRNVKISAAVGHVNGYEEPDFFSHSLRDLMEKASLESSAAKLHNDYSSLPT